MPFSLARVFRRLRPASPPPLAEQDDALAMPGRALAVAAAGVMLSVSAWFVAAHWEAKVAEITFKSRASNVATTLQTGLNEYLSKLVALRALFEASDNVTRGEFEAFAGRILKHQPAILGVSWIPRVPHAERTAHEQAAIRDGIGHYRIRGLGPDGKVDDSPERPEYYPVYYTTDARANAIYGFDLGDGGMREDVLRRARDSDDLAASHSLLLQTGTGDRRGFFVALPLYRRGAPHDTLEARRANLVGFVQGVFKIDVMVDTILGGIKLPTDFVIFPSAGDANTEPLLVRRGGETSGRLAAGDLHWTGEVKVADLRWQLTAVPSARSRASAHASAWILLAAGLLVTGLGVAFICSTSRQSTRLLRANQTISELALTDVVTALPNRRAFLERLTAACGIQPPVPLALLYVDLDHFKDVNDTLGHSTGDELLRHVSGRLRGCVGTDDLVARFGGDEFAVLCVGHADRLDIGRLAGSIIEALGARYLVDGNDIHVTVSVGITCSSRDKREPETLMMQADLALYRAKEDGRNGFRFHDWQLDQKLRERVTLADELRAGMERGELCLHYQPQVEIASGRLVGLEALVRWHHPTRGLVAPSEFIPAAEKTGLIIPLGNWVFAEACRQLNAWRQEGIAPHTLAVNLSAIQCRHQNLDTEFRAVMAQHAIPPDAIEVELTESVLMDTTVQQRDIVERLKAAGLRVAIDDFGTGYSSLNYLASYPVDRLKIAQELVLGVTADLRHELVVKAAIRLAHELGTEVIAEGVETEAQARFLVAAECRHAQGYLFSRPLTAAATTALLRRGRVRLASEAEVVGETRPAYPRLHVTKG